MILKFLAIGAAFYTCLYVSKYLTLGLEKRLNVLDSFYHCTSLFFQMAIKQEKDVLYVFEKLSQLKNELLSNIYSDIYNEIKVSPYQKIDEVWYKTISEKKTSKVGKEDVDIILDFGYVLSSLRSVKASSDFERYIARLYEYIKGERYKTTKKKQLYKKFGIVLGLFFVILII